MFGFINRRKTLEKQARHLYEACVLESHREIYYRSFDVPDTFDGRFEMLVLVSSLIIRRLRKVGTREAGTVAQAVFDTMFAVMDLNLREKNLGDKSVAKQMKNFIAGFYGRNEAYEAALDGSDAVALSESIRRNIYGSIIQGDADAAVDGEKVNGLRRTMEELVSCLDSFSDKEIFEDKNIEVFKVKKVAA